MSGRPIESRRSTPWPRPPSFGSCGNVHGHSYVRGVIK